MSQSPPPKEPSTAQADTFNAGPVAARSRFRLPTLPPRQPRAPRPRHKPRARRRSVAFAILTGFLVITLLIALDAVLSARRMLSGITGARNALIDGTNSVVTGDPGASVTAFNTATDDADSAISAAGHPSMRLFGLLPWVGDNIAAVKAVAQASRDTAQAGLTMAGAARTLGWQNILLPGVSSIGRLDIPAIRAATPSVTKVAIALQAAVAKLDAADSPHLLGPVAAGFEDASTSLDRRAALATDARTLMRLTPMLFGGNGPRRYLLAVESLGIPQAPGGRIGPVAVLSAHAGRLTLTPPTHADEAIAGTLDDPDLPTAAPGLLASAAVSEGPLNGVILVDTVGLQDLMWMVGDVDVLGRSQPLSQYDTVDTLEREVFTGTDPTAAELAQAQLAGDATTAVLERRPSTEAFATAGAQMVNGRHLAFYSTDPKVQRLIVRLGAEAAFTQRGNLLAVNWNSTADNRAGSFANRVSTLNVTLDAQGNASTKTVVELKNDAPAAPPSVLLGRNFAAEPVGAWRAETSVYLPTGAQQVKVETSSPSDATTTERFGSPVARAELSADSGGTMSMIVKANVPQAATPFNSGWGYQITIVPQPAVTPDEVRLRIQIPDGYRISGSSNRLVIGGTTAHYQGSPEGPLVLWLHYG